MTGPIEDNPSLGDLERELSEALRHLYDSTFVPGLQLRRTLGQLPAPLPQEFPAAIVRAIQELEPAPDVPPNSRSQRLYDILSLRYLQLVPQDIVAERLAMSPRHLRREQQSAARALAHWLWQQANRVADGGSHLALPLDEDTGHAWHSQLRQELDSLRESELEVVADVAEALRDLDQVARALTAPRDIRLKVGLLAPHLLANIHPAVLREVIIAGISELAHSLEGGLILIQVELEARLIRIALVASPCFSCAFARRTFIQEALTTYGGAAEVETSGNQVALYITLPAVDQVDVLVVEDNPDLVHLYQRYVRGTRYRITAVAQGEQVPDLVTSLEPEIIVLDVMLPGADGWKLLILLHQNAVTRYIPIIVVSVVREEELALALGASQYLSKPVRRQDLIEALDRAFSLVEGTTLESHAGSAAAD